MASAPRSFGNRFAGSARIAYCGIPRHKTWLVGNFELGRRAPEAFEIVIAARLFAEDVDDKAAEIEQGPFSGAETFAVLGRTLQLFVKLLLDFGANGLDLRRAKARANDEIFRECAEATEGENGNGGRLPVFCSRNGEGPAAWQAFPFHRHKPCLTISSSTSPHTTPS